MRRGFDRDALVRKFQDAQQLPDLPSAAVELVRTLDEGESSASELEKIILLDPSMTAAVLRNANSALFGGRTKQASTVRGSILLLGERSVRSIAFSIWLQSLVRATKVAPSFQAKRFADHSMVVGFLSRQLVLNLAQRRTVQSDWSLDQVFVAAALHDLAVGILAASEPSMCEQVLLKARVRRTGIEEGFQSLFETELVPLGAHVARAWRLPTVVEHVIRGFTNPFEAPAETDVLCCVHYANWLAETHRRGVTPWATNPELDPNVVAHLGVDNQEGQVMLEQSMLEIEETEMDWSAPHQAA